MVGNVDSKKSITGYVYTLGGTTISWLSKLQKIVILFTTEVEYAAITEANIEMMWLQSFLKELDYKQKKGVLHYDSQSAIHLAKNPAMEDGVLVLKNILGSLNPADMLTKTVSIEKLKLSTIPVGLFLEA